VGSDFSLEARNCPLARNDDSGAAADLGEGSSAQLEFSVEALAFVQDMRLLERLRPPVRWSRPAVVNPRLSNELFTMSRDRIPVAAVAAP
jgi:hypothetical protein